MLRREKVVGKFVEFFGEGTASLSVPDRATIGNMAPEYGATMGFFPVDDATVEYLRATGRTEDELDAFTSYFKAQQMFGIPRAGDIDYTKSLTLDLATIKPSLAGPKRPQDRIEMDKLKSTFTSLFSLPISSNGFAQPRTSCRAGIGRSRAAVAKSWMFRNGARQWTAAQRRRDGRQQADARSHRTRDAVACCDRQRRRADRRDHVVHEHLESRRAARRWIAGEEGSRKGTDRTAAYQTSLAPGSRVVTEYLTKAGLLPYPRTARLRCHRVRLHDVHRQRRRPDTGIQRDDHQQRSRLRRSVVG